MEVSEAADLITAAVTEGGTWADLGAGSGTFTRALASLLGAAGTVYAVDRSPSVRNIARRGEGAGAAVLPIVADFSAPLDLPELDGILMANSLHFVEAGAQGRVVAQLSSNLKGGGAFALVEYDQRRGQPWVPYPVPPARFAELAKGAGLAVPRETGRRRSRYGPKDIYAAVAMKR